MISRISVRHRKKRERNITEKAQRGKKSHGTEGNGKERQKAKERKER